ncbi:pectin degradation protein KdgF [Aspergillus niger]|nr:pectin degradation protein KdgF [Aspergillus niger]
MARPEFKLKALLNDDVLEIEAALEKQPHLVIEALIEAFLLCPMDEGILARLQLGDCFRRSLQSSRQRTPYRLHTIVSECKSGRTDSHSLEGKFYNHGGIRAVAALATAATDNKQVVTLLKHLPERHLQALLRSIDDIEPHRDFIFIVETLSRRKPPRLSKRKSIPEPRSRRRYQWPNGANKSPNTLDEQVPDHGRFTECSARNSLSRTGAAELRKPLDEHDVPCPRSTPHEIETPSKAPPCDQASTHRCYSTQPATGDPAANLAGADSDRNKSQIIFSEPVPNVAHTPVTGTQYPHIAVVQEMKEKGTHICYPYPTGVTSDFGGTWQDSDNFRIDLDNIHAISYYDKDSDNSALEHYGIDLDTFNAS